MTSLRLADRLVAYLERAIKKFPQGFYDSMGWTCTGKNFTHPITWGLLVDFARKEVKNVVHVGIDVRFNTGTGEKFQPDVVAFGGEIADLKPLFFIDYESPNSSDGRPVRKDLDPYLAWCEKKNSDVPYIVITTLPKKSVACWSKWDCTDLAEYRLLKRNPYRYWYPWYKKEFAKKVGKRNNVALININGTSVERVFPA
jgi:hypothetical protein